MSISRRLQIWGHQSKVLQARLKPYIALDDLPTESLCLSKETAVETLPFETSAQFKQWAERVSKYKYQRYDRVPVGKQVWTYNDGHVAETAYGKRGGTLLANLSFILNVIAGRLEHTQELRMVQDIDSRGGVVISINWDE